MAVQMNRFQNVFDFGDAVSRARDRKLKHKALELEGRKLWADDPSEVEDTMSEAPIGFDHENNTFVPELIEGKGEYQYNMPKENPITAGITKGANWMFPSQSSGWLGRAGGGHIPGNSTGDTNPALLEDREYVLNRKAVEGIEKENGKGFLDYVNYEKYPRYATGGSHTSKSRLAASALEDDAIRRKQDQAQSDKFRAREDYPYETSEYEKSIDHSVTRSERNKPWWKKIGSKVADAFTPNFLSSAILEAGYDHPEGYEDNPDYVYPEFTTYGNKAKAIGEAHKKEYRATHLNKALQGSYDPNAVITPYMHQLQGNISNLSDPSLVEGVSNDELLRQSRNVPSNNPLDTENFNAADWIDQWFNNSDPRRVK